MAQTIVVLNAGSSSIKFSIFAVGEGTLALMLRGQIEGLNGAARFVAKDADGALVSERTWDPASPPGHDGALEHLIGYLRYKLADDHLIGVGHRVVHGGLDYCDPVRITPAPGPIETALLTSGLIHQVMIIGEGRVYLSALVVPEFDHVREHLAAEGKPAGSDGELAASDDVRRMIAAEIDRIQKDSASFERIRRFTLRPRAFSLEEGEITPTLKIRRSAVEKKFAAEIAAMYEGVV